MRLGRWGRFPLRMGGGKPEAQRIYEQLRDGRGDGYSRNDGAIANLELAAYARAIARAASAQRRGALQAHPSLATDLLPDWLQRLGLHPDARDTDTDKRAYLVGVLRGTELPTRAKIIEALAPVFGEQPEVVVPTAPTKTFGATVAYTPTVRAGTGGALAAGTYAVSVAWETADGVVHCSSAAAGANVLANGKIRVGPVPLSVVSGAIMVHYYLSVAPGEFATRAWVATGNGNAISFGAIPRTPATPSTRHYGIVASRAVITDRTKLAKARDILDPMLPADATRAFVDSSPFLLGVSALGLGGF